MHPGRRVTWYGDDTQRSRAIALLNALLGSYGRAGGLYVSQTMKVAPFALPPYPKSAKPRADGGDGQGVDVGAARRIEDGHAVFLSHAPVGRFQRSCPRSKSWTVYSSVTGQPYLPVSYPCAAHCRPISPRTGIPGWP